MRGDVCYLQLMMPLSPVSKFFFRGKVAYYCSFIKMSIKMALMTLFHFYLMSSSTFITIKSSIVVTKINK